MFPSGETSNFPDLSITRGEPTTIESKTKSKKNSKSDAVTPEIQKKITVESVISNLRAKQEPDHWIEIPLADDKSPGLNDKTLGLKKEKKIKTDDDASQFHEVTSKDGITNPDCGRSLGKVEKFFLKICVSIFGKESDFGKDLQAKKQLDVKYKEFQVRSHIEHSLENFQPEGKIEKKSSDSLMKVSSSLFIDTNKHDLSGRDNKTTARLAVSTEIYLLPKDKKLEGLGTLEPRSFDEKGKLTKNKGIIPTSFVLGKPKVNGTAVEKDHLTNIYIFESADKKIVIRTGRIDTEQRANDFIQIIEELYAKNPGKPLRAVSHQLNSFETESKMIDNQHYWISQVNKKLEGKAEVIHINTPFNRWYHMTVSLDSLGVLGKFIKSVASAIHKNSFKSEKLSKLQNYDSLGTYVKWVKEDMSEIPIIGENNSKDFKIEMNILENNLKFRQERGKVIDQRLSNKFKDNEYPLSMNHLRSELKDSLSSDYISLRNMETILKNQPKTPELIESLQKISLMKEILRSQLGITEGEFDPTKAFKAKNSENQPAFDRIAEVESLVKGPSIDRGKENMMFQKLNDMLRVAGAINCKSGLDRTALAHAMKLATLSYEKELLEIDPDNAVKRSFDLVNEWDSTTNIVNAMTAHLNNIQSDLGTRHRQIGQWLDSLSTVDDWRREFGDLLPADIKNEKDLEELKTKIGDVLQYRKEVLKNLIEVCIPITTASTGVMGLKWNSGMQENLMPLNFLPSHVVTEDGAVKPLVLYESNGKPMGISKAGREIATKFMKDRGS